MLKKKNPLFLSSGLGASKIAPLGRSVKKLLKAF